MLSPGDLVVAVCDTAYEELSPASRQVHWSVPDPGPVDTDEIFEEVVAQLAERVDRLAALASVPGAQPGPATGRPR